MNKKILFLLVLYRSMSQILEQIFGKRERRSSSDLGNPNLRQGERFDWMQNTITSRVLPALPLMEQTTGPGLGSIVEPLENADNDAGYTTVSDLNSAEMKKLQAMESQYEALITQLIKLNSTASTAGTYENHNAAGNQIKNQLSALNKKIMTTINKLIKQTYHTNSVNNIAKTDGSYHASNLRQQLNTMMERKSRLDGLLAKRETLSGQLTDRRNELQSTYMHYIAWLISSITLAAIAFNKLSKN